MTGPTDKQRVILDDSSRIRVVRAVPGSGKTWLVAELIRREFAAWTQPYAGIAALSFTRVGGDEIRRAVGSDLPAPHFVGTIDAFLYRYVLRPFLQKIQPSWPAPRLIPADWEPNYWSKSGGGAIFSVTTGTGQNTRAYSLLAACFLGAQNSKPTLGYLTSWGGLEKADIATATAIMAGKEALWGRYGYLTHSDAAYLTSEILTTPCLGSVIRKEIARRFPFLVIDELQDTGWFLGQSVLSLLTEPDVRALLTGDPDQAIYEFNGARPDLFDRFVSLPSAKLFELDQTRRCGAAVCAVATNLATTKRCFLPNCGHQSRAILLAYKDLDDEIPKLVRHLFERANGMTVKVIARQRKTVNCINGGPRSKDIKLKSKQMDFLHHATMYFRRGRNKAAYMATQAALANANFGCEHLTDDELNAQGIDPALWRCGCIRVLLETDREIDGETFEAWGKRISKFAQDQLAQILPCDESKKNIAKPLRQPAKPDKNEIRKDHLQTRAVFNLSATVDVSTVHGVKGETHDLTVFVCPKPHQKNKCPSVVWWSKDEADQEERRIAFVAVTRTRGDLIFCVSEDCLDRLRANRPEFLQCFEILTLSDLIDGNVQDVPVNSESLTEPEAITDARDTATKVTDER